MCVPVTFYVLVAIGSQHKNSMDASTGLAYSDAKPHEGECSAVHGVYKAGSAVAALLCSRASSSCCVQAHHAGAARGVGAAVAAHQFGFCSAAVSMKHLLMCTAAASTVTGGR